MPKQKQKQKQTVIVNIGDKVVRRRRRKRVGKAKPRPPDAPQAPRPQFVQTLYPVVNPIQSEQLQFNLANINKQLQTLQDKQLNATANLMSGRAAIQRAEDEQAQVPELGTPESESEFFDPLFDEPKRAKPKGRPKGSTKAVAQQKLQLGAEAAAGIMLGSLSSGLEGTSVFSEPSNPPATPSSFASIGTTREVASLSEPRGAAEPTEDVFLKKKTPKKP